MLVAGCTTTSPENVTPQPTSPVLTTTVTPVENPVLPMDAEVVFGTGDKQFTAWIDSDSFESSSPVRTGSKQTITIYVAVKNTGTEPVQSGLVQQADGCNG